MKLIIDGREVMPRADQSLLDIIKDAKKSKEEKSKEE